MLTLAILIFVTTQYTQENEQFRKGTRTEELIQKHVIGWCDHNG